MQDHFCKTKTAQNASHRLKLGGVDEWIGTDVERDASNVTARPFCNTKNTDLETNIQGRCHNWTLPQYHVEIIQY